jgi:carbon storage regulator CsrA
MLTLTRRFGEVIVIDLRAEGKGLVEVVVVDIRGTKVRLGVTADPSIPVDRRELFDAKELERGTTQ